MIRTHFGDLAADKFRFEEMKDALFRLLGLTDLPKTAMSLKTEALLEVYNQEKHRHERIEEIEREAANPPKS